MRCTHGNKHETRLNQWCVESRCAQPPKARTRFDKYECFEPEPCLNGGKHLLFYAGAAESDTSLALPEE